MNMQSIKRWLLLQKEGMIVGAAIGILLYYMKWNLPISLPGQGIQRLIVLVLIFAALGAGLDAIWEPRK